MPEQEYFFGKSRYFKGYNKVCDGFIANRHTHTEQVPYPIGTSTDS